MAGGFNIPEELENMMVVLLRLSQFKRGPLLEMGVVLLENGVVLTESLELFLPDEVEVSGEAGQLFRVVLFL